MLGAGLQMCRNTSKSGNDAMSIYTLSETDSDYIRQATLLLIEKGIFIYTRTDT